MSVKLSVAQKATVVPIGTKDFLPIQDPTSPPGEPRRLAMPPGVRIRSKKCVEINFTYNGATHFERLKHILPTVGGVLEAAAFRDSVLTMIANNRFRYSQTFPDSLLVKRARETEKARQAAIKSQPEMLTIGEALDAWLVLKWASFSPNTREDYVRIVRTDLKALDLTSLELGQDAFLPGRHSGSQPRFAGFALNSRTLDEERTSEIPKTSTVPSVLLQLDVPLEPDEEPSTRRRRKASALRKTGDAEGAAKAMTTKTIWERQAIALHGSELVASAELTFRLASKAAGPDMAHRRRHGRSHEHRGAVAARKPPKAMSACGALRSSDRLARRKADAETADERI